MSRKEDSAWEEVPKENDESALPTFRENIHMVAGICEKAGDRLFGCAHRAGGGAAYRKMHLFDEENLWLHPGDEGFTFLTSAPAG